MLFRSCLIASAVLLAPAHQARAADAVPEPLALLRRAVAAHANLKPSTVTITQAYYEFPPMEPIVIYYHYSDGSGESSPVAPPPSDRHVRGKECPPYGKATTVTTVIERNDADHWRAVRTEFGRTTTLYAADGRVVSHTDGAVEYGIVARKDMDMEIVGKALRAIAVAMNDPETARRLSSAAVTRVAVDGQPGYRLFWPVPPFEVEAAARLESLILGERDGLIRRMNMCGRFGNVQRARVAYKVRTQPFVQDTFFYPPDVERTARLKANRSDP